MRSSRFGSRLALAGTFALSVTVAAGAAWAADNPNREAFTAFAVSMGTSAPGAAGTVDIVIERYSTDAEREKLMTTFIEQGPDKLLRALQKIKPRVGYIRTSKSLGYDLRFAWQQPLPGGGRRILIATDRRIGMWEARNQPRTMDYPFMLIEMRLDANDQGQGKVSVATKITMSGDKKTMELENYDSQPVRLNEIKKHK
jgi:hypothetical protein